MTDSEDHPAWQRSHDGFSASRFLSHSLASHPNKRPSTIPPNPASKCRLARAMIPESTNTTLSIADSDPKTR